MARLTVTMAEGESADNQTGVPLDQPTLEAIIEGVSQRILKASTGRAAESEASEGERAQNTGKSYRLWYSHCSLLHRAQV